jgi:capsular exopolysaccharide synthesis family protein
MSGATTIFPASAAPFPGPPPAASIGSFGLRDFVGVLNRRLMTFLVIWALVAGLIIAAIMSQPRMYVGGAQVSIETMGDDGFSDPNRPWAAQADEQTRVDSEVGIVTSTTTILRVVEARKLMTNPEYNRALRRPGLLSRLFPAPPVSDPTQLEAVRQSAVIDQVRRRLDTRRVGRTRLIQIEYRASSPEEAALMANLFAEQYIATSIEAKRNASLEAADWLRGRIGSLREDVTDSERNVAKFRAEAGLLVAEGSTLTESQLSDVQAQLSAQRADLGEKQAQLAQVRDALEDSGASLPSVLQSQTIVQLRSQEAEVLRRLGELRQIYGPEWPELKRAEQELKDIRAALDAEIRRTVATVRREARVAQDRVAQLEARAMELRRELAAGNVEDVRLKDLERNAQSSRTIYEAALQRLQLDDLRSSYIQPPARLVSRATLPRGPSEPNPILALAVGLLVGLAVAAATIALLEFFDRGFWSARTFENATGIRSLGLLPRVANDNRRGLFGWLGGLFADASTRRAQALGLSGQAKAALNHSVDHPNGALAESLRSLRANIAFAGEGKVKTVLVTSPTVDEGKTFIAIGLARAAAQSGARVLLIDCDLKRRGLSRAFNVVQEVGLMEVLQRKAPLTDVLVTDEHSTVRVVPLAAFRRQSGETLLEGETFKDFIATIAPSYDLIVLDGGALLLSANMKMVSSWVDGVVLALKWRSTSKGQVETALDLLARARANLLGSVLTQADVTRSRFFEDGDMGAVLNRHADYFAA